MKSIKQTSFLYKMIALSLIFAAQRSFSAAAPAQQVLPEPTFERWNQLKEAIKSGNAHVVAQLVPVVFLPDKPYFGQQFVLIEHPNDPTKSLQHFFGLTPSQFASQWYEQQQELAVKNKTPLNPIYKQIATYIKYALYLAALKAIQNNDPQTVMLLLENFNLEPFDVIEEEGEKWSLAQQIELRIDRSGQTVDDPWAHIYELIWIPNYFMRANLNRVAEYIPDPLEPTEKIPTVGKTPLHLASKYSKENPESAAHFKVLDYVLWIIFEGGTHPEYAQAFLLITQDDYEGFKKIMLAKNLDINKRNNRKVTLNDAIQEKAEDPTSNHRGEWLRLITHQAAPASPSSPMKKALRSLDLQALEQKADD